MNGRTRFVLALLVFVGLLSAAVGAAWWVDSQSQGRAPLVSPDRPELANRGLTQPEAFVVEDVEPGVSRIVNDGVRDLTWDFDWDGSGPAGVAATKDGAIWIRILDERRPSELLRLGRTEVIDLSGGDIPWPPDSIVVDADGSVVVERRTSQSTWSATHGHLTHEDADGARGYGRLDGVPDFHTVMPFIGFAIKTAPDDAAWLNVFPWNVDSSACDGIARFDGETWTHYLDGSGTCIADFDIDSDGAVWALGFRQVRHADGDWDTGPVQLFLISHPDERNGGPPSVAPSPSAKNGAADAGIVTESTGGTFRVRWTRFDAMVSGEDLDRMWSRPPEVAAIASDAALVPTWVIPPTVCHPGGCHWVEFQDVTPSDTDHARRWVLGGPQPPGSGRFRSWVEQGVLLDFNEDVDLDVTVDRIRELSKGLEPGQPLPWRRLVVEGRETPDGVGVCAGILADGSAAINVVVPRESGATSNTGHAPGTGPLIAGGPPARASATGSGDRVPSTALWMTLGPELSLDSFPGEWWRDGGTCSAGYLNGDVYAFSPLQQQLWHLDGQEWVSTPLAVTFSEPIRDVVFAGNRAFLFVGSDRGSRSVWTSDDLASWKATRLLDTIKSYEIDWDIKATDFGWLAVAVDAQQFFLSVDGVAWEAIPHPGPFVPAGPGAISEVHVSYADDLFILTEHRNQLDNDNIPDWVGVLERP